MRTFISAALEYTKHPNETTASVLQRNLGVISVSLDLSIFDPKTSIAAEFYVSLHELMNSLGSRTTLIWSAVDVLQNACRNAIARQVLIHTYKFAPILARLLEANLTTEKRMRVLKLLQELTYGIKISWQEAHLPYLISVLTQWVTQSKEEDIIALSLGVLKDVLLLRHIIDFFDDVGQNEHSRSVLVTYASYGKDVEKILEILEDNSDPECVALIMEFLSSLVKLKLPTLISLYSACVKSAMTWVPVEQVSSKALALIRMAVIDSRRAKTFSDVLAELDPSVLMLIICAEDKVDGKDQHCSSETMTRLAELMQLFQEMVKIATLRPKVVQSFNEQVMYKLLKPILDYDASSNGDWQAHLIQNPTTNFCIHALALTADLAANNSNWLTLYTELLSSKAIQMRMAQALFMGDGDVKQKVLQLTATVGFPQECVSAVAFCMKQLEPLMLVQSPNGATIGTGNKYDLAGTGTEMVPLFSFAQEERLDSFLAKLKRAYDANQIGDVTTSAVMELYEYKLAAMRHAERAMQSSLEAANNHSTSLQHRLAQVVAESSRLHQMLFDAQQCLEGVKAEKYTLVAKLGEIEEQSKKTLALRKQEIEGLKKIVADKSVNIDQLNEMLAARMQELEANINKVESLSKRVKELEIECSMSEAKTVDMSTKNHELSKLLHKMQESLAKREQIIEVKSTEIESNHKDISALKQETQQLMQLVHTYEQNIAEKESNIQKLKTELTDLSRMRDMIFELTAKKKDELNTT
ncbi:hypothetical protein KM043_015191 [Ampulex compressa]|nr:hypothetical protein KM043_015191 [Ampulex compressa]